MLYDLAGLLDTIRKVVRYEGPWSLWNGAKPAVVRQVVFYSASMVLYTPLRDSSVWPGEATKQSLIAAGLVTEGTVGATMGASLVAGFAGAVVSSP
ncbi:hypothetical protein DYB31_012509 [Aphanomyces astaci]|uniref:Uncharacterized protein n=1 Tax=Aphanomyces astaci TaxID=112090 RepID=A0A397ENA6_APHAT|nr:hypothetical protein DYB31_012509 [Aphanomyces astaci]